MDPAPVPPKLAPFLDTAERLAADLADYHPKTILIFGSVARCLKGLEPDTTPHDVDILVIGDIIPEQFEHRSTEVPVELHRLRVHDLIRIARSLRYDPKALLLSRLYGDVLVRRHARNVIAACLLLGPGYNRLGIEQIEIDGGDDPRDYSVCHVVAGNKWWQQICEYARCRRGPFKRFSDKLAGQFDFSPPP